MTATGEGLEEPADKVTGDLTSIYSVQNPPKKMGETITMINPVLLVIRSYDEWFFLNLETTIKISEQLKLESAGRPEHLLQTPVGPYSPLFDEAKFSVVLGFEPIFVHLSEA